MTMRVWITGMALGVTMVVGMALLNLMSSCSALPDPQDSISEGVSS